MKAATRRYARYQSKWLRKRLFEQRNPGVVPPVYLFDSSNAERFHAEVVCQAMSLMGMSFGPL